MKALRYKRSLSLIISYIYLVWLGGTFAFAQTKVILKEEAIVQGPTVKLGEVE